MLRILITGGMGFIGSNFLMKMIKEYPENDYINLDKLTYAANPLSLEGVRDKPNYNFVKGDIARYEEVEKVFNKYELDVVVHFAAESHVDRSILGPAEFIQSNIVGTFNLLEGCRNFWGDNKEGKLFHHVSTDEVYGSLGKKGLFTETTSYDPSSPYSASKAASDHLVRAYHRTYGLPITITNCSNNYGPYQFPEKLIPVMVLNCIEGKPLPIYGQGCNVRDWLYVEDHCDAIWTVIQNGKVAETYNVGGNNEWKNIDIVNKICEILAEELDRDSQDFKNLITFVKDRPGHDLRYALDASKIETELNWRPHETFETGLRKTIKWYLNNKNWVENVKTGDYTNWINTNYDNR